MYDRDLSHGSYCGSGLGRLLFSDNFRPSLIEDLGSPTWYFTLICFRHVDAEDQGEDGEADWEVRSPSPSTSGMYEITSNERTFIWLAKWFLEVLQ